MNVLGCCCNTRYMYVYDPAVTSLRKYTARATPIGLQWTSPESFVTAFGVDRIGELIYAIPDIDNNVYGIDFAGTSTLLGTFSSSWVALLDSIAVCNAQDSVSFIVDSSSGDRYRIARMALDGSGLGELCTLTTVVGATVSGPSGLAHHAGSGKLYLGADASGNTNLIEISSDGTSATVLNSSYLNLLPRTLDIDYTNDYLYMVDNANPTKIYKGTLAGGAPSLVFTAPGSIGSLQVNHDDQRVYYSIGAGDLRSIALDGTDDRFASDTPSGSFAYIGEGFPLDGFYGTY